MSQEPMTDEQIAEIAAAHEPWPRNGPSWCHACERPLPCDAVLLLAEVDRLTQERDAILAAARQLAYALSEGEDADAALDAYRALGLLETKPCGS